MHNWDEAIFVRVSLLLLGLLRPWLLLTQNNRQAVAALLEEPEKLYIADIRAGLRLNMQDKFLELGNLNTNYILPAAPAEPPAQEDSQEADKENEAEEEEEKAKYEELNDDEKENDGAAENNEEDGDDANDNAEENEEDQKENANESNADEENVEEEEKNE